MRKPPLSLLSTGNCLKGAMFGRWKLATCAAAFLLFLTGEKTLAQPAPRVVTLEEALSAAAKLQPQLRQARSATAAARAVADEAMAPLLPQASMNLGYERTTANYTSRPGTLPASATGSGNFPMSWKTFNFFSGSATVNQLIWDFNQTSSRWRAAQARIDGQRESERAVALQVALAVRSTYFTAHVDKELVEVARQTLHNLEKHLMQTEGMVAVGTAPEIDLAQARTNLATGRAQLVSAENAYLTAKALLNQAVGWTLNLDYEVADRTVDPVEGEDSPIEVLEAAALKSRPELASLQRQLDAQLLTVRAIKGGYAPTLSGNLSVTPGGTALDSLSWNVAGGLSLTWPLFQGGMTRAQVREAEAVAEQLSAQIDQERMQVRVDLEQARLAVRAAKALLSAQLDAVVNARDQLRLAEGRYAEGVGNGIEIGDAQVALTSAEAQQVQTDGQLATARAQLLYALGHW
ncbi:outer membrane efflux protein, putative [Stigmatella aurantiaca DW4/3-1]|nr:outer membrane efflux protein, putative [Stigmatella aurantiaca DW4/3-1]